VIFIHFSRNNSHIEILNPRYGIDGEGEGLTREEHDALCAERIRQAELAGHKIIRIQPARGFD